jgi:hypothetical protein
VWIIFQSTPYVLLAGSAPKYIRCGQQEASDGFDSMPINRLFLKTLEGLASKAGEADMASLMRWFLAEFAITEDPDHNVPGNSRNHLSYLLFYDKSVIAKAPSALTAPIPALWHFPGAGVFVRTGWGKNSPNYDHMVAFMGATQYWLDGHSWDVGTGLNYLGNAPIGLMIYKRGPLLHCRGGGLRGPTTHNPKHRNTLTFVDPAIPGDGFRTSTFNGSALSQYTELTSAYCRGVHRIFQNATRRCHVIEAETTKCFNSLIVQGMNHTWVVVRGSATTKDDWIFEHTRVRMVAGKEDVTKRWTGQVSYDPHVDGAGWVVDSAARWHADDPTYLEIDANNWGVADPYVAGVPEAWATGRLFVTPLVPAAGSRRIYKRGGAGYEFMDEDPASTNPPNGQSGDQNNRTAVGQWGCGGFFFHVEPTTGPSEYENFLLAFQVTGSPISRKTVLGLSGTGFIGAHAQDATDGDQIVIFSSDMVAKTGYSYTVTVGAAGGAHTITGLDPTYNYIVKRAGVEIVVSAPYVKGSISFASVAGAALFEIVADGAPPPPPPPPPPPEDRLKRVRGLRL